MSLCKIIKTLTGVEYLAKSEAGAWRNLSADDILVNGEAVKVFTFGPEFGKDVYTLQNRVSGAWVDAETVSLDLPSGTSHTRIDKLNIAGDATNSTLAIAVTHSKGHGGLKISHLAQLSAEQSRGMRFLWKGALYAGVMSEITKGKERMEGGYLSESDARLVANREQFADQGLMPLVGQVITAGQDRFVITAIDVSDVIYNFELRRDSNA